MPEGVGGDASETVSLWEQRGDDATPVVVSHGIGEELSTTGPGEDRRVRVSAEGVEVLDDDGGSPTGDVDSAPGVLG